MYAHKCIFKLIFLFTLLSLFPSSGFSELKEIISEGTYNMGDGETPMVAESRALLHAKRIALEKAGTYIESYSKTKNFQLTHDEINVLASGVMEVVVLEKKRTFVEDGVKFWVRIKARVTTDKIEEMARKVKDKLLLEDYRQLQKDFEKSQQEIDFLKRQLKQAKSEEEKKEVAVKIRDEERLFEAKTWYENGVYLGNNGKYDEALEAFTSAIVLDPNSSFSHAGRGVAYVAKGQYDKAIEDHSKAISLDPNNALAYGVRGAAFAFKGQYVKAFEDYNRAIALVPNSGELYWLRGATYVRLSNTQQGIIDFKVAARLGFKDAQEWLAKRRESW